MNSYKCKRNFKYFLNSDQFKDALKEYCGFQYQNKIKTESDIDVFLENFENHVKKERTSLIWLQHEYDILEKIFERTITRGESFISRAQNLLAYFATILSISVSIGVWVLSKKIDINAITFLGVICIIILSIYTLLKLFQIVSPTEKYELKNIFNDLAHNESVSELVFFQIKVAHTIVAVNLSNCQNQEDGKTLKSVCFILLLLPFLLVVSLSPYIISFFKNIIMSVLCQCCH